MIKPVEMDFYSLNNQCKIYKNVWPAITANQTKICLLVLLG